MMDTEYIELFIAKETKLNLWKWVKKHKSQIDELDKLKLKVIVLNDDISKEVHIT